MKLFCVYLGDVYNDNFNSPAFSEWFVHSATALHGILTALYKHYTMDA